MGAGTLPAGLVTRAGRPPRSAAPSWPWVPHAGRPGQARHSLGENVKHLSHLYKVLNNSLYVLGILQPHIAPT